jgi:hypothetical protein
MELRKTAQVFVLFIMVTVLCCLSCQKSNPEPEKDKENIQLFKVTSWTPRTNVEVPLIEFHYDDAGKIINSLNYNGNTLNVYYSDGKIVLIKGLNSKGGEVSYAISYNNNGQRTKVVYVFMDGKNLGYTTTYEYNSSGNVSKSIFTVTDQSLPRIPAIYEYTWSAGNIIKCHFTNGIIVEDIENLQFDDKLNPLVLSESLYTIVVGFEQSKNNVLKVKSTITGSAPNNYERTYGYNVNNYASSMNLVNLLGDGYKYYFAK